MKNKQNTINVYLNLQGDDKKNKDIEKHLKDNETVYTDLVAMATCSIMSFND